MYIHGDRSESANTSTNTSTIDMLTPTATAAQLRLDDHALLDLVNQGRLRAYDLGGTIRFRASDVGAIAQELAAV